MSSDYDEQPQNPLICAPRMPFPGSTTTTIRIQRIWDLPVGDEEEQSGKSNQTRQAGSRKAFSHIEVAPILTLESGRPVNPLDRLDSNRATLFLFQQGRLNLGRDSLKTLPYSYGSARA